MNAGRYTSAWTEVRAGCALPALPALSQLLSYRGSNGMLLSCKVFWHYFNVKPIFTPGCPICVRSVSAHGVKQLKTVFV